MPPLEHRREHVALISCQLGSFSPKTSQRTPGRPSYFMSPLFFFTRQRCLARPRSPRCLGFVATLASSRASVSRSPFHTLLPALGDLRPVSLFNSHSSSYLGSSPVVREAFLTSLSQIPPCSSSEPARPSSETSQHTS